MKPEEDIRPILTPVRLSEGPPSELGVWFILKDIKGEPRDDAESNEQHSTFSKLKSKFKDSLPNYGYGHNGDLLVVPIRMSDSEYHAHFSHDPGTGEYFDRVSPPPGGRLAWVRQRYEEQNPKSRKIREVSGYATKVNALGMTPGGVLGLGGGGL